VDSPLAPTSSPAAYSEGYPSGNNPVSSTTTTSSENGYVESPLAPTSSPAAYSEGYPSGNNPISSTTTTSSEDGYVDSPLAPTSSPAAYLADYPSGNIPTTLVTSVTAGGYTGDSFDSLCPKTCNPFDPAANKCDITTSCTTTGNGKYYCACRAGFMASAWNPKDFSKQFKFAGQPYVYTAEGVVCDKVCSDPLKCDEVMMRPQCQ
jgi:hypothetical protein